MVDGPKNKIGNPFKRKDRLHVEKEVLAKNPELKFLQNACNETNTTRAQLGPKATSEELVRATHERLNAPPPAPVEEKRELEAEEEAAPKEDEREQEPEPEPEPEQEQEQEEEPSETTEVEEETDFVPGLTCSDVERTNDEFVEAGAGCCAW